MMPRYILVVTILLGLGGCAGNPEKQLAIACQGYASTLGSLAVAKARGQLSQEQINSVDVVRPSLNAICLDGIYSDPVDARNAVETAMWELILIERDVQ